jgi:replicative DNA helicase
MITDERVVDLVLDIVTREDFYDEKRGLIFTAIVDLRRSGDRVGFASVVSWLKDRGTLEAAGGAGAIAALANTTPSIGHAVSHAKQVALKSKRRGLIAECQIIEAEGFGDVGDEQEFLEQAAKRIRRFAEASLVTTSVSLRTSMDAFFQRLNHLASRRGVISGYPTGLKELDRYTAGLHGSDVVLVGGETGRGKTSFAMCLAINVASAPQIEVVNVGGQPVDVTVPIGVAVFSLEMPHEDLSERMVCAIGRVDLIRLRSGDFDMPDMQRITSSAGILSALPIEIDDDQDLTVSRLEAKVARIEAKFAAEGVRLGLVILDYVQLVDGQAEAEKGANRERQLSEVGRRIKKLAGRLRARPRAMPLVDGVRLDCGHLEPTRVCFMVLTQLNEDGDARESKALMQHANAFWVLEHSNDSAPEGPGKTTPGKIRIKKQRSGPRNVVASCWWHEAFTLYSDEER